MKLLARVSIAACVAATCFSLGIAQEKKEKDEPKTERLELNSDLVAQVPASWKVQTSEKQFRLVEGTLPSAEKGGTDGVLVVFHFGKGGGGDLDSNLKRWYSQVEQPDGSPTDKAAKKQDLKTDAAKITWVEVSGTLLDRPFPASPNVTKKPKYRMFAAMIDGGKDGPYWVRATGPDAAMLAHREGFEKFLKSIAKK